MTIRDLTPEQLKELQQKCKDTFKVRDKTWKGFDIRRYHEIREASYELAFSDGVKAALAFIQQPS